MRPSNKRSRSKSNRPRPLGNIINRVFDSSGPEGKVRGTPQQIIDKYLVLARDAQLSNDRVAAENFLQHAEHYTRMLGEAQRELAREAESRRDHAPQQQGHNPQQNRRAESEGSEGEMRDDRREEGQTERRNERRDDPRPEFDRRDEPRRDEPRREEANRSPNRRESERREGGERDRNRSRDNAEHKPASEPMTALETDAGSMLVETPESRAQTAPPAAPDAEAPPAPKPRNRRAPKRKPATEGDGAGSDGTSRDAAE
jgi:hypothetical protein